MAPAPPALAQPAVTAAAQPLLPLPLEKLLQREEGRSFLTPNSSAVPLCAGAAARGQAGLSLCAPRAAGSCPQSWQRHSHRLIQSPASSDSAEIQPSAPSAGSKQGSGSREAPSSIPQGCEAPAALPAPATLQHMHPASSNIAPNS